MRAKIGGMRTDSETAAASPVPDLPASAKRLLDGAIACFAARGYQASTTRDISNHAGLSPGSLYVHFEGKEQLLFELTRRAHGELLAELLALPPLTTGSELQLVSDQIRTVTHWHVENHELARVAQHELANLTDVHFQVIREQRNRIESILMEPVVAGCEASVFQPCDARLFMRAMLSLTVDVIRWYTPTGRYTAADLADNNVEILTAYLTRPAQK